jgi:hypothetical protein|tara:strand:+ start:177 stop:443 length:267 start_codon:yes stop_codon:yes gene_type:complete
MKSLKELNEDIEQTRVELINWAYGFHKEGGSFFDRHKFNIVIYGLMIGSLLFFYLMGWMLFFRIVGLLFGIMFVMTAWGYLRKWMTSN